MERSLKDAIPAENSTLANPFNFPVWGQKKNKQNSFSVDKRLLKQDTKFHRVTIYKDKRKRPFYVVVSHEWLLLPTRYKKVMLLIRQTMQWTLFKSKPLAKS